MKVVDKRTKDYNCQLYTLCVGATFVFEDELYMLLDFKIGYASVVSLETGLSLNFATSNIVTPVFVECHIVKNVEV